MKRLVFFLLVFGYCASAQEFLLKHSLDGLVAAAMIAPDTAGNNPSLDSAWLSFVRGGKVPLVEGDSVAFLYRGKAKSVRWMGDFNRWGSDTKFESRGIQVGSSNLWIWKYRFPEDARLDYKIFIDESRWILDPANPRQQWSGVGGGTPNSELRMTKWQEDPIHKPAAFASRGHMESDILLHSEVLEYQFTYSVYLPVGYNDLGKLPVIYVTDGYEYMHPRMGDMVTVLDNLIAAQKIVPIIAVFIDHREPVNRTNNRRMDELAMNDKYLKFFTDELIPHIEASYRCEPGAAHRAVLGTSMGGLNAAYFVFAKPGVFSMAGIQSPAFYTKPQIYSLCEQAGGIPMKISMTSGTINDTCDGGRKMKTILDANACTYTYREVNEGHSWGNWRNLIDDILVDFFASKH